MFIVFMDYLRTRDDGESGRSRIKMAQKAKILARLFFILALDGVEDGFYSYPIEKVD